MWRVRSGQIWDLSDPIWGLTGAPGWPFIGNWLFSLLLVLLSTWPQISRTSTIYHRLLFSHFFTWKIGNNCGFSFKRDQMLYLYLWMTGVIHFIHTVTIGRVTVWNMSLVSMRSLQINYLVLNRVNNFDWVHSGQTLNQSINKLVCLSMEAVFINWICDLTNTLFYHCIIHSNISHSNTYIMQ